MVGSHHVMVDHMNVLSNHQGNSRYVMIVLRHWQVALASIMVAVVAAFSATLILARVAPRYQAAATLILTGPRYQLTLDPKFATVNNLQNIPVASRTDEYTAVAQGSEV